MRPVCRGPSPQAQDFVPYGNASADLFRHLGRYCSYCERVINSGLAIEHMRPKSLHPDLEGRWDNFLLACGPCNSTKGTKDLGPADVLWPDRDNTFVAFDYRPGAAVVPRATLTERERVLAEATLAMVGLDKAATQDTDLSTRMVA